MMARTPGTPFLLTVLLLLGGCATTFPPSAGDTDTRAVASAHPLATEAGLDALRNGGNAFDAAVATAAVLAVVEPYSAGMGGGGFWLLQEGDGTTRFVDAREKAPAASTRTMYLDADGNVHPDKLSINGPMAAGIPGQPGAFVHISERYGQRPLQANLQAAIDLARDGFPVDERYQDLARWRLDILQRYAATRDTFLQNGQVPALGTLIRQPALANTLQTLADRGWDGFYDGPVARRLVDDVRAAGGIWQLQDLRDYTVEEREPVVIHYGDATVWSAPPPSSGGIALAQMFGMMTQRPFGDVFSTDDALSRVQYRVEVMRRAYRDRAVYLGDPDYTDIPVDHLLDPAYLNRLMAGVDPDRATPSTALDGVPSAGTHTTHLSVMDAAGRKVSATLSINLPFGSGFLSGATGVLLNNEMDDFAMKPGVPNAYGLVGGEANSIEPGKRPLSSMTPSILQSGDRTAIIGTPGGSRIITMVYLGLLDVMAGRDADAIVGAPRYHHQYLPDVIQHEPDTFTADQKAALTAKGYELKDVGRRYGNMQLILRDQESGEVSAAADPRGIGAARVEAADTETGG
ncbi:gamma-glutamyltransferase [Marinobacter sp. JSM 1782161]|uniref:gamma-glutamyltransferase n=1 Tax=Marinobacter sp. JSM 1782161 TaxID=2685906 RepID=UPI001403E9B6|nr:gamma-glutamyltransferase [Marinobacter sp. JSM 1782161]